MFGRKLRRTLTFDSTSGGKKRKKKERKERKKKNPYKGNGNDKSIL